MKEKLSKIFSECLKVNEKEINDKTSPENVSSWDSLGLVTLVMAIEKKFKIKLSFEEIRKFTSFKEVCEILNSREGLK